MTAMDRINSFDRINKGRKIAKQNREFCSKGSGQFIGRPQGPKAKGHKTPATGITPVIRSSVIPNGNSQVTPGNAARAKSLKAARAAKIKAAKNSVA